MNASRDGDREVGQVQPVRPLLARRAGARQQVERRGKRRQHHQRQEDDQVVEREDAQRAPRIEAGEVAVAAARVDQDAGDQEAGEDEEEIHARPADEGGLGERAIGGGRRRQDREVMEQHQEDGDAAQAIECRSMRNH